MTPADHPRSVNASTFMPPATYDPDISEVCWYRRGRHYIRTMMRAVVAAENGNPAETIRLLEYADEQLWPLDRANSDTLREFIAGINCETEVYTKSILLAYEGSRSDPTQCP